jgi:hypothetical protein
MKLFGVILVLLLVGCDGSNSEEGEGIDGGVRADSGASTATLTVTSTSAGTSTKSSSNTTTKVNTTVATSTSTHTTTTTSTNTTTYVATSVISNPGQPTQTQTSIETQYTTAVATVTTTATHTATVTGIDTSTVTCVTPGTTSTWTGDACFTALGVYADMGANPCADLTKHPECKTRGVCCWNPLTGSCSVHSVGGVSASGSLRSFSVCDGTDHVVPTTMVCGGYYVGNPSGGNVCIPASKS